MSSSAYSAPDSPIASAKRPRTIQKQAAAAGSSSTADAGGTAIAAKAADASALTPPLPPQADAAGKWRTGVSALFSPVLRFLGAAAPAIGGSGASLEGGGAEAADQHSAAARSSSSSIAAVAPMPIVEANSAVANVPEPEGGGGGGNEDGDAMDLEPRSTPLGGAAANGGAGDNGHCSGGAAAGADEVDGSGESDLEDVAAEGGSDEGDEHEGDYDEFNPFLFMQQLPPYESVADPKKLCLPARRKTRHTGNQLSLVLDLDETLVHCTIEPTSGADVVFPIQFNGVEYKVHVAKRPHLEHFLQKVVHEYQFEVIVFTASQRVYADALLDLIDPRNEFFKHRLFREACLFVEGNYLKDLNVLGRDMARMVLVDNSPHAYGYQVDNGIPIVSWFDDKADTELLGLLPFLERLTHADDVRPLVRDEFQTHKIIADAR